MPIIKTVGIISKPNAPAAGELIPKLLDWLNRRGIQTPRGGAWTAMAVKRVIDRAA